MNFEASILLCILQLIATETHFETVSNERVVSFIVFGLHLVSGCGENFRGSPHCEWTCMDVATVHHLNMSQQKHSLEIPSHSLVMHVFLS